jgi:hypothetical protein
MFDILLNSKEQAEVAVSINIPPLRGVVQAMTVLAP